MKGYNDKQVVSWLVAVLLEKSTADAIKEALASAGCGLHS